MFWHIFTNRLKVTLRSPEAVFWLLVFPFVLSGFFYLAFNNLDNELTFSPIPVAVVSSEAYQESPALKRSIEALSSGNNPTLIIMEITEQEAEDKLEGNEVSGIISVQDDQPTVTIKSNGFEETIIATSVDQTLQASNAIMEALNKDPTVAMRLDTIGQTSYIIDTTNQNVSRSSLYFYTLIGMACIYAGLLAITTVNLTQANLSKLGLRMSVAPASRAVSLVAGLMSGFVIAYAGGVALYLFMVYILGVEFGAAAWAILLVIAAGVLAGLSLGTLVAAISKRSENVKIGILVALTMVGSFLAGMMGTQVIKHAIDQSVPFLAAINPVDLVSDALLSVYYFGIGDRYYYDIVCLLAFSVVSIVISWFFLRKRSYASL